MHDEVAMIRYIFRKFMFEISDDLYRLTTYSELHSGHSVFSRNAIWRGRSRFGEADPEIRPSYGTDNRTEVVRISGCHVFNVWNGRFLIRFGKAVRPSFKRRKKVVSWETDKKMRDFVCSVWEKWKFWAFRDPPGGPSDESSTLGTQNFIAPLIIPSSLSSATSSLPIITAPSRRYSLGHRTSRV